MSAYTLSRDITINARPADVFPHLDQLPNWQAWSPWAKLDPQAKMTYSEPAAGVDAFMDWEGNRKMGAGRMTVLERLPERKLRYRLEFRRPMTDTAEAQFDLKPAGDGTHVTWTMRGEQNLVGRMMWLLFVGRMLARQFEQGLHSLKDVAES